MINMSEMMEQFEFQDEQIRSQRMLIGELLETISELQATIKRVEELERRCDVDPNRILCMTMQNVASEIRVALKGSQ